MPRRVSGPSIAVSFSTRGALIPAWMVQHIAVGAGIDGIDVDATSPLGAWLAARSGTTDSLSAPVRSIWTTIDGQRMPRVQRLIEDTAQRQPGAQPLLVLTLPGGGSLKEIARAVQPSWGTRQARSIAIGLPSASLRGGRPHLVQLGVFRRFAEEWDIDVAVDLSGRFDPTWEAEAAISRIGARLALLRMTVSAPARSAVGRDRVACRALHAAIDRSERLEVALSSGRSVPFPMTPRTAARAAQRAAEYVSERALFHAQALREGIDSYQGSPSGGT